MIGEVAVSSGRALAHACREGCGACCIAPSISSPIPGMPDGKPAGVRCAQLLDGERCAQLLDGERCAIFGRPERPACCSGLRPSDEMCGASRADALAWLARLEADTRPAAPLASAGDLA
ncbi:putative zinc-/iron-chelating domain protein [Burkholderia pseudomallei]|nr:putative zinc-/iron-chelating domain protein [Burkholderia pseudomallei]CAJ2840696.1 putative zinc-/iron-chelating domain protein [Burkholderia pseudomallei]CAJ4063186.1 putative zinc-/iron-chelating domain protein [Burkholderia pseudomallei]CAJ9995065.1 putative zinc-/iron-chelating domain protein [Burkholderia pseudomallei]